MATVDPKTPRRRMKEETALIVEAKKSRLPLGTTVLSVLLLVAVAVAGYFYYELKWSGRIEQEKETEELVATIGQFIELPAGEAPTMATVTDREKLADQPFFAKAENGDKVLIYSNSGRAILYRPSTQKVIDMTTTQVIEESSAPAPVAAEETVPEAPLEEGGSATETPAASSAESNETDPTTKEADQPQNE